MQKSRSFRNDPFLSAEDFTLRLFSLAVDHHFHCIYAAA